MMTIKFAAIVAAPRTAESNLHALGSASVIFWLSLPAALDELVRSTSVELARNAAQSEFVVVKVSTPILADRGAQLEWCTEVSKQIDRLRKDESFALQYDGQSLPIPGYPAQIIESVIEPP